MIETITEEPRIEIRRTTSTCKICGTTINTRPRSMSDEVQFVCTACRCSRCGIVLSRFVCPCGALHGIRSQDEKLCERCYDHNTLTFRNPLPSDFEDSLLPDVDRLELIETDEDWESSEEFDLALDD